MNNLTVIRNTSTGDCHLLSNGMVLDDENLEANGFEIAGQLLNSHAVTVDWTAEPATESDEEETPEFTTCEASGCPKWLMLDIEGGAPSYCTEHEALNV